MSFKNAKDDPNKNKYFWLGLTLFISGAALIGVYYILFHSPQLFIILEKLSDILMPVLAGGVLSYVLIPVLNCIEGRIVIPILKKAGVDVAAKKNKIRALSVSLTSITGILTIYIFIHMFIAQIIPSIQEIAANFDTYVNNAVSYFDQLFQDNPSLNFYFNQVVDNYSNQLEAWLNGTIMPGISTIVMSVSKGLLGIFGFLWDFIIGFILSIYILNSKDIFSDQAKKITYSLLTKEKANNIIADVRYIHKTFTGFLSGKVIDSIIIGLLCFIGTSILKTPYAALVSLIIGATNIIPFFGPFLGAIPCSILIFVVAPLEPLNLVYFIIFILLLQQFDGNILGPKILGNSTGLSSFWVIFSITVFGGIFGVPGMVIGVPTFAVIFAMIRRYVNGRLEAKHLPTVREEYQNLEYIDENNQIVEKE